MQAELNDKIMSASDAVRKFIKPGTHIAFGGFTILRRPNTIAREIVRQEINNLYVTMNGGTYVEEMLAGAGLIRWLESTYLGLEGGMPVAYAIRQAIECGEIELVEDYSNWSFALRTVAGKYGLPFMPCMTDIGTDLIKYDTFEKAGLRGRNEAGEWIHPGIPPHKYVVMDDPFDGWGLRPREYKTGQDSCPNKSNFYSRTNRRSTAYTGKPGVKVALVPPLLPEVSVVRAQRVAIDGTIRIEGLIGPDVDQTLCARNIIVECERVCSAEEIRTNPEHNQIPGIFVKAIVEQPFGAYPTAMPNYYDYDYSWFRDYTQEVNHKSKQEVVKFWREYVQATENDWGYLSNIVGWEKLWSLRSHPKYHYNPDYDRFC
jgi:glutaconate CoA-transferase subunit A